MKNKEYEELCSQKNKEQVSKKANETARGKLSWWEKSQDKAWHGSAAKDMSAVLRRNDKLLWEMSWFCSELSLSY